MDRALRREIDMQAIKNMDNAMTLPFTWPRVS